MRRMASAAAAKKWRRLANSSEPRRLSPWFPPSRNHASCTSAVASSVWPGFSFAICAAASLRSSAYTCGHSWSTARASPASKEFMRTSVSDRGSRVTHEGLCKPNSCSLEKKRKIAQSAATILSSMAKATLLPGSDEPNGIQIDWTATLAAHDRWLRTAVLARLGERQAVDEVMQEVALAAVAQRAPLHDPARVGAWLYRIAVRPVLLYRRPP